MKSQVDGTETLIEKTFSSTSEQELQTDSFTATDTEIVEEIQNDVEGEKSEETEKTEISDEQLSTSINLEGANEKVEVAEDEPKLNTLDKVKAANIEEAEAVAPELEGLEHSSLTQIDGTEIEGEPLPTSIDGDTASEVFETRITKENLTTDEIAGMEGMDSTVGFRSASYGERAAVRSNTPLYENPNYSNSVSDVTVTQTIVPVHDRQGKYRVNVEVNNINNRGSRYVFNIESSRWMDSSLNIRDLMYRVFTEIKAKDSNAEVAVLLSKENGTQILLNFTNVGNALNGIGIIPTNVSTYDRRNFISSLVRLKDELFRSDSSKNYTNLNYIEIWSTGIGNSEWNTTTTINDPFFEQNPQIKHYVLYEGGYNSPSSSFGETYGKYINSIVYDDNYKLNSISGIIKGIIDKTKVGPGSLDIELDPNVAVFERLEMPTNSVAQGSYENNHIRIDNISAGPKDRIGRTFSFNYYIYNNPNTILDTLQSIARTGSYRLFSKSNETASLPIPKIAMPGITLNIERIYDSTVPSNVKNPLLFSVRATQNTIGISHDNITDERTLDVNENNIQLKRFPKFDSNGNNVRYNVDVENLNSALTKTFQPEFIEGNDGTFRLYVALKPLDITVHRIWESAEQRPTKIKLLGYVNDQPVDLGQLGVYNTILDMPIGVSQVTYHALPRITADGAVITYSVQELEENGSDIDLAVYKVDYNYGKADDGINEAYTVTNYKKYTVISIPNHKVSVHTISITKIDTANHALNGSRFAIKSANSFGETDIYNETEVADLNREGEFSFTNSGLGFNEGTYYISEIHAPNGYQRLVDNLMLVINQNNVLLDGQVLNDSWQEFGGYLARLIDTDAGKKLELRIKNLKIFALHLKKRNKKEADQISSENSSDYDYITKLKGAVFRLELIDDRNGGQEQVIAENLAVGDDGYLRYDSLVQGHYRLTETTVPDGYRTIEPIHFSVNENFEPSTTSENATVFFHNHNYSDLVVIVKNEKKNKDIKIFKVDSYHEKLNTPIIAQNVQFKIFASNSDGSINRQRMLDFEGITNEDINQFGSGRDDLYSNAANNEEGYSSGLYYLEEVRASNGYHSLSEPVPFYIDGRGTLTIPAKRLDNGSYVKDNDRVYSNWFSTGLIDNYGTFNRIGIYLTVENPNKAADFKIKKLDNDDNVSLSGVRFEVYSSLSDGTRGNKLEEAVTDNNGETSILNNSTLKYKKGLYFLLETETKVGYQRIENEIPFYIKGDSSIIIPAKKNELGVYVEDSTADYGNVNISSQVENNYQYGDDKVLNIITIGNKKKQINLRLTKTDFENEDTKLSHVGFQLYGDNMTTIIGNEKFTDDDGVVTFENLQIGTYYIAETTAKQGYLPNDKKYKIVIDDDGNVSNGENTDNANQADDYFVFGTMTDNNTMPIMVKNERIKKIDLKILKVDSKGNKITTSSAQFQILNADKQLNETKTINNITPIAHADNGLDDVYNSGGAGYGTGLYYLNEIKAPQGFVALSKPIPLYIDERYKVYAPVKLNEHGEVEMQNENGKHIPVIDTETYEFRNDVITYEKFTGYQYGDDKVLIVASIKNRREPLYPQTGGVGSMIFYLGGMLLMMVGFVLYQHGHYKNE